MEFEPEEIDVRDGGIWISRKELERKFHELREKGYANYKLFREGCTPCLNESITCHAKADVLWSLIEHIEEYG